MKFMKATTMLLSDQCRSIECELDTLDGVLTPEALKRSDELYAYIDYLCFTDSIKHRMYHNEDNIHELAWTLLNEMEDGTGYQIGTLCEDESFNPDNIYLNILG